MKFRSKKTGEIGVLNYFGGWLQIIDADMPLCGNSVLGEYRTVAKLCEEWEDIPEGIFYICHDGEIREDVGDLYTEDRNIIGNCFSSREEAVAAAKKLQAWKRLKDKGFKFNGWEESAHEDSNIIYCIIPNGIKASEMDLLFGGEE